MSNASKQGIAAGVALIAILCARWAPADGMWVSSSDGVCCIEPFRYAIPRMVGQLSLPIVAVCILWVIAIWPRSRRG